MQLPLTKPVHVIHSQTLQKQNYCLAIILVDESHIEKNVLKNTELLDLDKTFDGVLENLVSLKDFEGKWLQSSVTLLNNSQIAKRLVVIGCGKKDDCLPARSRQIGIKSAEIAVALKAENVVFLGTSFLFSSKESFLQARIGFEMGTYKYPNSNMKLETKSELEKPVKVTFVSEKHDLDFKSVAPISESILLCRLLQDGPPNVVTPKYVSSIIEEKAKNLGLKVQIMGAEKLKSMGFGAMMAVAGGSANEPQFVVVEYTPQNYKKTVAFVGKGLTMDTGGYSLKSPSTFQEGMKYDMSGSAVALSSILAIAQLKLPVRVFAVGALCENMVDAHSYRVGDILTTYSGKTIEVIDTDAEGRVVLSDALYYAANDLKPDYIVEYSTLTGAIIVALGHVAAGVFAFDKNLENVIVNSSSKTGEKVHSIPVFEEVAEEVKGQISDVVNLHKGKRTAGSMVGAAFLKEFVKEVPYAHIDIAGVSDSNAAIGFGKTGSSGYGVQLSVEIARSLA